MPSGPVHLASGEKPIDHILPVSIPEWPNLRGVLRFLHISILVGVLRIGIVGRLELPLPTQVVRVPSPELDLVVFDHGTEGSGGTCG